jgi:large subunit ribosomal protein L25
LELDVEGKKEKVLPRDVAYHVVSEEPIHIDFMRVISGKKIVLEIPVKFINHPDSPGLKRGGDQTTLCLSSVLLPVRAR